MIISYRRFGTTFRVPIGCPETSARNCHYELRSSQGERSFSAISRRKPEIPLVLLYVVINRRPTLCRETCNYILMDPPPACVIFCLQRTISNLSQRTRSNIRPESFEQERERKHPVALEVGPCGQCDSVKVLPNVGRWFDSRWCHWNFSLT